MNFLAHIYLSGDNQNIILGNFIAEGIRSSQLKNYSQEVQKGIKLHRLIDDFTDSHAEVKSIRELLYARHGKYAWVLTDIYYDHFLAINWKQYSATPLKSFTQDFYKLLWDNEKLLTKQVRFMLPYMEKGDWLYNYQFLEGIERVLQGMSRRASFENTMNLGVEDLKLHYETFESSFKSFFPELQEACDAFISQ